MDILKRADGTLLQSSDLLALLAKMKDYIESVEVRIDHEWGYCRDFNEIHKAGDVTEDYDLICELISTNTETPAALNSSSADSSMLTLRYTDGTWHNYTKETFNKLKSKGVLRLHPVGIYTEPTPLNKIWK